MEAGSVSETSINVYQTTRRNNREDSYLHTLCRENLKSHLVNLYGRLLFAVLEIRSPSNQDKILLIALMMEAASTSETSVSFYQTIRRNNPEDSLLHDCPSS
jgi:hypothetical protein